MTLDKVGVIECLVEAIRDLASPSQKPLCEEVYRFLLSRTVQAAEVSPTAFSSVH